MPTRTRTRLTRTRVPGFSNPLLCTNCDSLVVDVVVEVEVEVEVVVEMVVGVVKTEVVVMMVLWTRTCGGW